MLIFIDSQGNVVGRTPGGLTQGSSKANVLQLVAPFPTAIASVSFQLPNGIVLGPGLEDGLGETADEYVMTEAFKIPGYGVGGSELTVFNFTCNKQITALAGNLGIQFFLSIGEIIEGENGEPPVYGGYTIAVPMINVPVYNGTRFIPNAPISPENYDIYTEILQTISGIKTTTEAILQGAVLKDPTESSQTINSDIILGPNRELRAPTVTTDKLNAETAEIANGGELIFSDIGTEFPISPTYSDGRIDGLNIPGKVTGKVFMISRNGELRFIGGYRIGNRMDDEAQPIGIDYWGGNDTYHGTITFDRPKCESDPEEPEDLTTKSYVDQAIYNLTVGGVATFNDDVYIYGTLRGQSAELTDAYIDGTLVIAGDLTVNGKTTAVEHETLIIKDNIIVTNSDGLNITASGIVINKGNGKAYGIIYQPQGDLVYIGEGTYSVSGGIPYFDFDIGQALPLAARSENFPNGEIPIFDAATASFKPSGKTMDGLQGQIDSITAQINGVEETLAEINDGGIV